MSKSASRFVVNVQCTVVRDGRYLMIVRGDGVGHAPGVLAFPGGKVETDDGPSEVLEKTAVREVLEETGVRVSRDLRYIRSNTFVIAGYGHVVDVLFLGEYESGEPTITDTLEVADILWMTAEEILGHSKTPPWLKVSVEQVESVRRSGDKAQYRVG